jgi:hypothetical protein
MSSTIGLAKKLILDGNGEWGIGQPVRCGETLGGCLYRPALIVVSEALATQERHPFAERLRRRRQVPRVVGTDVPLKHSRVIRHGKNVLERASLRATCLITNAHSPLPNAPSSSNSCTI